MPGIKLGLVTCTMTHRLWVLGQAGAVAWGCQMLCHGRQGEVGPVGPLLASGLLEKILHLSEPTFTLCRRTESRNWPCRVYLLMQAHCLLLQTLNLCFFLPVLVPL